jgi:hypothetical protein
MPPTTYLSPFTDARCSAVVSATFDEVGEAAVEWARDLGWEPVTPGSSFLAFKLGHAIFSTAIEMEVSRYAGPGTTKVQFLARARNSPDSDWNRDMERAAETFAHGVLYELRRRGASIDPSWLATARKNRKWLAPRERLRRLAEWCLVALCVPVMAMVWFLSHNTPLTVATPLWFIGAILMMQFARMRTNGIHARLQVLGVLILMLVPALGLTIAAAFV